jgi:hypothetical protein
MISKKKKNLIRNYQIEIYVTNKLKLNGSIPQLTKDEMEIAEIDVECLDFEETCINMVQRFEKAWKK